MANERWTPSQKSAIETLDKNLLVSASAGSGKTSTMIERVLRMIISGKANVDEMLICTFTKKSANDMKEKLYRSLCARRSENSAVIERNINLLPIADISTLHSWCQKIIKSYFYVIDVDPGFDVIEDVEAKALLSLCVDEVIEEELQRGEEGFMNLYESLCMRDNKAPLKEIITKLYDFAMTQPNSEQWLDGSTKYYDGSFEKIRNSYFDSEKRALMKEIDECMKYATDDKFYADMEQVREALISGVCDLKIIRNKESEPLKSQGANVKTKVKAYCSDLAKTQPAPISPMHAKAFCKMVKATIKKYRDEKDKKAKLDFSDLEHYALEIINDERSNKDICSRYKYVFVDEFQDINPLQERILRALKTEQNSFYVGDLKQSIYAFRNCDPKLFEDLLNNYEDKNFAKPIDFSVNFRSAKKIVKFVNDVFNPLMTQEFGSVDYKKCPLVGMKEEEGEVGIKIYKKKASLAVSEDYDFSSVSDEVDNVLFAREIVVDINEKIKAGAKYNEIAVLSHKRTGIASAVYDELKRLGIPVCMNDKDYFTSHPYLRFLIEFLKYVDNMNDEIAFVGVCNNEIFGVTENELARTAKSGDRREGFMQKVRRYISENDDELSKKYAHAIDFANRYSEYSAFLSVGELLGKFIVETDYFNRTLASYGAVGAGVLSDFLDNANSCIYGDTVENYLRYIEDGADSYSVKAGEDCVSILTVHASKGLEFPYVYLVGCDEPKTSRIGKCLYHKDLGIALETLNMQDKRFEENPLYNLCKLIKTKEEKEEHARLLYVALTRAMKGLYIYAKAGETKKANIFSEPPVPPSSDNFFGWMGQQIVENGFEVVEGIDEYSASVFSSKEKVYKSADENVVKTLFEYFENEPKFITSPLKTSVTARAGEGLDLDLIYKQIDEIEKRFEGNRGNNNENEGVSALQRGTVFHKVMEMSNFDLDFFTSFENSRAHYCDYDFMPWDMLQLEKAFYKIKEIAKTYNLYREKEFIYNDDGVLVQGVIDLLAIKENHALVIDYKTTSMRYLDHEKVLQSYKKQVEIYAKATSEILGYTIDNVLLYSFELGDFIEL